jgi:hypothetical protein
MKAIERYKTYKNENLSKVLSDISKGELKAGRLSDKIKVKGNEYARFKRDARVRGND